MSTGVGIVIPAYQPDPERIRRYIEQLSTELQPARLHVELDMPSRAVLAAIDGTEATVRVANKRRGKGAAITAGFECLDTPIRCFVDADGSTPPAALASIIDAVAHSEANLAVGSRRHPDATVTVHQTRIRRRLGDLFVRLAQRMLLVELYDYQCGAKAIDAETWEEIRTTLTIPGFAWDIELIGMAVAAGAHIVEVPIEWEDQSGSTVPVVGTASEFARALVRTRRRARYQGGSRWHAWLDRLLPQPQPLLARAELRSHDVETEKR